MLILSRYFVGQYLRALGAILGAGTALFLIIHFFDRIGHLMAFEPPLAAVGEYFVLKIPSMISEIYPPASLLAVLTSLGLAARNHEILALRASGISTLRLAVPLLVAASMVSVLALAFNEVVVPPASERSRHLYDVVIKKKTFRGLFNASSIWFQDRDGFIHIDFFDAASNTIYGLTDYEATSSFRVRRMIEVPIVRWRGEYWHPQGGTVSEVATETGDVTVLPLEPSEFHLEVRPGSLATRSRRPEEFSFRRLRKEIAILRARGLNTDEMRMDLHYKVAWAFAGLVNVLVGFPLAVRTSRTGRMGRNMAMGMVVGFAYFVVTAIAISAGRNGAIDALLAAWAGNIGFAAVSVLLFLTSERG